MHVSSPCPWHTICDCLPRQDPSPDSAYYLGLDHLAKLYAWHERRWSYRDTRKGHGFLFVYRAAFLYIRAKHGSRKHYYRTITCQVSSRMLIVDGKTSWLILPVVWNARQEYQAQKTAHLARNGSSNHWLSRRVIPNTTSICDHRGTRGYGAKNLDRTIILPSKPGANLELI